MNFFEEQRKKLDVSRTVIAARLGAHPESVRQWEANIAEPRHTIAALAEAYETTVAQMEKAVAALVIARRRQVESVGAK